MSEPSKDRIESMCESYLRNLGELLQKKHKGEWDEDFATAFVGAQETAITKLAEQSRAEVIRIFREWRKTNKK